MIRLDNVLLLLLLQPTSVCERCTHMSNLTHVVSLCVR